MTCAWFNMMFSASYALSFVVVHLSGVGVLRCVGELRNWPNIVTYGQLCQHICPSKRLRAFALLGVFASTVALILFGSTAISSLLTM